MLTHAAQLTPAPNILNLRIEDLRPHPLYRDRNCKNATIRLANSVKKYGILHPLAVRATADANGFPYYEIIDGHHRYHAALLAGTPLIPCQVLHPADPQCARMSLIAALKGQESHFFDQAKAFRALVTDHHMTQEEVAGYMSLSQSAVANKLRLLQISDEHQQLIREHQLTERHARALLRLPPDKRTAALEEIIRRHANVAETEHIIEKALCEETPSRPPEATPAIPIQAPALPLVPGTPPPTDVSLRPIRPSKFALRDLRPLYNSIERALGIFRKTGATVDCQRREDENDAYILIHIPKGGTS